MKVFIVAALLVAAVASQELDLLKLGKEKSMLKFNRPVQTEMTMKHKLGYPLERFTYGDYEVPKYIQDYFVDQQVLRLEEIILTPLFREYYTLPYFRQFWSYPYFQKYVASVYFQRFWQIPTFRQYFADAGLFYKYIYPIVTLFKYDATTMTPYGDDYVRGDYTYRNKNVFPFVYGQRDSYYPTVYNQDYKQYYDQVYYKNILDKIYNHVYPTTYEKPIVDETYVPETVYGERYYNYNKYVVPEVYGEQTYKNYYYPEVYKYNPFVARYIYGNGYNKRFPTYFNKFDTEKVQYNRMFPTYFDNEKVQYNRMFDNVNEFKTFETPKMTERIPIVEGQPITFDKVEKVIPEIVA